MLVCVMLCGLFAVIPVSAAESANDSIFQAYEPEKHPDWWTPSTTPGYDGHIKVNAEYAVSTKTAYNMEEYAIVLNNLTGGQHPYETTVIIAPQPYNKTAWAYDPENGLFTIRLLPHTNMTQMRVQADGYISYKDIPFADTYDIRFYKEESMSEEGFPTTKYYFRVNEALFSSDDYAWIKTLMESESFKNSYISFGSNQGHEFNAKIAPIGDMNKEFTPFTGYDSEGYQKFSNSGNNGFAITRGTVDLLTTTLSYDAVIEDNSDKNAYVTFSTDGNLGKGRKPTSGKTFGFEFALAEAGGTAMGLHVVTDKTQHGVVRADGANIKFEKADEYNFSVINIDEGKYALVINDVYYTSSLLDTFMNNLNGEQVYISVSGIWMGSFRVKVDDTDKLMADFACNNAGGMLTTATNESGDTVYTTGAQCVLTTTKKVNLFETTFEIDNLDVPDNTLIMLGFTDKYGQATKRTLDVNNGILVFDLWKYSNLGGWRFAKNPTTSSYFDPAVPFEADNSYKINFVKEGDGTYAMYVNDVKYTADYINTFCEKGYAESAFVSIAVYSGSMSYTPIIKNISTSSEVKITEADVKDNTLKNVNSGTTVTALKEMITVGEYYGISVADSKGRTREEGEALGSGDKISVTYRGKVIADIEYDVIVLADTDGDAAITATDLINVRKELLGATVDGIYRDALDAHYDNTFNILDLIATKKASLN